MNGKMYGQLGTNLIHYQIGAKCFPGDRKNNGK